MSNEPKCPFHGSRTTAAAQSNSNWWPKRLNLKILSQHSAKSDPMDAGFDYAAEFNQLDYAALKAPDDRLAGLVAGRLGPLRRPVHPHGLAQRRHLPHGRRPRRRRHRQPALRAAQQLARQRQPRQGAPPAVADQAEVRQRASPGPT
jgi:hypothetical protein